MKTINIKYSFLFILPLIGCLSYSYRGLVGVDSLPNNSLIGISYENLVIKYGMPDRVTLLNQNMKLLEKTPTRSVMGKRKSEDFLATYNFISSYDILLYYRDRGYTYTFLVKDGIVTSITSLLNNKTDGIGFRNGGMGAMGMAAAGGGLATSK